MTSWTVSDLSTRAQLLWGKNLHSHQHHAKQKRMNTADHRTRMRTVQTLFSLCQPPASSACLSVIWWSAHLLHACTWNCSQGLKVLRRCRCRLFLPAPPSNPLPPPLPPSNPFPLLPCPKLPPNPPPFPCIQNPQQRTIVERLKVSQDGHVLTMHAACTCLC